MWSTAGAEEVGMSSLGMTRVSELARRYVAAGRYPGAVTVVARRDRVMLFEPADRWMPSVGSRCGRKPSSGSIR